MQFFCANPSCSRTIRTNSHTSTVLLLLILGNYTPKGIKIKKIIIMSSLQLLQRTITFPKMPAVTYQTTTLITI